MILECVYSLSQEENKVKEYESEMKYNLQSIDYC